MTKRVECLVAACVACFASGYVLGVLPIGKQYGIPGWSSTSDAAAGCTAEQFARVNTLANEHMLGLLKMDRYDPTVGPMCTVVPTEDGGWDVELWNGHPLRRFPDWVEEDILSFVTTCFEKGVDSGTTDAPPDAPAPPRP